MRFRPCIDIHNGKVKQIVGGSLNDQDNQAEINHVSEYEADFYAKMYQKDGLRGGHVILLNASGSEYYEASRKQGLKALSAYKGGLQIGGGITSDNAEEYLRAGASHVIVTSYVFQEEKIQWEHLEQLRRKIGKDQVVLDLSCRRQGDTYYVVTDRWQRFTEVELSHEVLTALSEYCDEFLVHGVDMEGTRSGIEEPLVRLLASWKGIPITYAGGIGSMKDLRYFEEISKGRLDFTIGSALDLFGGDISYKELCKCKQEDKSL